MFGSSTPLTVPDWHPVHRANALLRAAMLSSTAASPRPFEAWRDLDFPSPLSDIDDDAGHALFARFDAMAEEEPALPPLALPAEPLLLRDSNQPEEAQDASRQLHMQTLVHDFQRRQRQASLLVAGCLAAAFLLTVGGLMLIASFSSAETLEIPVTPADHPVPSRSTSIAWQKPTEPASFQAASLTANQAAKGAPSAQVILATSGRSLELSPLLPRRQGRYLLLRGLPAEAELSAGKRSASGAWMVKNEEVRDLTLRVRAAASGDYPVEVYLLDTEGAPGARRHFVLRVEAAPRIYAAGMDASWATALLDMALGSRDAEQPVPPAEPAMLLQRARQLIAEGDIAAARLLLTHLAERGQSEAAYELARTFDREMLAAFGAADVEGDSVRAYRWYEQASQRGNAKAAMRLKILASLSGRTPSD